MIWIKANGLEIKTNDELETVEYCEQLGWTRKGDEPVETTEKKTVKAAKKTK